MKASNSFLRFFLVTTLFVLALTVACTNTRVVQSHYIINTEEEEIGCKYVWKHGDYWEFLAWAILDDLSGSSALAITAGYSPEQLPADETEITISISAEFEDAVESRMAAARLIVQATDIKETDRNRAMSFLREAARTDPSWSVPLTNIAVLLLEQGNPEEALQVLEPVSHKNIPAYILASIAWNNGDTDTALRYLAEAMATSSPAPEVLASIAIIYSILGEVERASSVINKLLENPDAPPELRILVLEYALKLTE